MSQEFQRSGLVTSSSHDAIDTHRAFHKDLSVARSNADRQSNRKLDVILRECMEFDVVVIGGAVVVAATLKC
jgi:hypothetical protein